MIEVVTHAYLRQGKVGGWLGWSWVRQGTHGIGTQGEIRVGVYYRIDTNAKGRVFFK